MPMPNVMISDLLGPHVYTSPLQFCSRACPSPLSSNCCNSSTNEPFKYLAVTNFPLYGLDLVLNRTFSFNLEPLSLFFFSISTLPLLLHTPAFLFQYFRTTIFPERPTSFQVRFHYRFSCRPWITLFSDKTLESSEKIADPSRPSTI